NRARAVAHGLDAVFDVRGRPDAPAGQAPPTLPAVRAARELFGGLADPFRQLDVTAPELAALCAGIELSADDGAERTACVRTEDEVLALWWAGDRSALAPERLAQGLLTPEWLAADHLGAANGTLSPGGTAAVHTWLADRLSEPAPAAERHGTEDGSGGDGSEGRAGDG
ncbi:hypothetical protein G3I42_16795, partial [Streptomyces sp. SID11385]|nr:hypothetical protein [Streptomyces sp. SID11385]